jgi:hypothetical protein
MRLIGSTFVLAPLTAKIKSQMQTQKPTTKTVMAILALAALLIAIASLYFLEIFSLHPPD